MSACIYRPLQASTIFDTACSERIQQFDDAESDDDDSSTWNDKEISFVSPVEQEKYYQDLTID